MDKNVKDRKKLKVIVDNFKIPDEWNEFFNGGFSVGAGEEIEENGHPIFSIDDAQDSITIDENGMLVVKGRVIVNGKEVKPANKKDNKDKNNKIEKTEPEKEDEGIELE